MWKTQLHRCGEKRVLDVDAVVEYCVDLSPLAFPDMDNRTIQRRLELLKSMGVEGMYVVGDKKGEIYPYVVGKGSRGVVILCKFKGQKAVVKLRRTDASVVSMVEEAEKQLRANKVKVGPKVLSYSDEAILMEYVKGRRLGEFLEEKPDKNVVRSVFRKILEKCFTLDKILLSHNQLRDASSHVIVRFDGEPEIIDYSHAKITQSPKNVSQFISYVVNRLEWRGDKNRLYKLLGKYKKNYSWEVFQEIVHVLKLESG